MFNPAENEETGEWTCRKYIGASDPCDLGTFNDELMCRMACTHLNILDGSLKILRKNFNLDLQIKEIK